MYFIITIATASIMTNTANGFLPSQSKGLVRNSIMFLKDGYFYGIMSTAKTKNNKVKPLEAEVRTAKLIEYNFLFKGIKFVKGYTITPNINDTTNHIKRVFFSFYLLSFIIKQNKYPK
jgi:hypothetical protein